MTFASLETDPTQIFKRMKVRFIVPDFSQQISLGDRLFGPQDKGISRTSQGHVSCIQTVSRSMEWHGVSIHRFVLGVAGPMPFRCWMDSRRLSSLSTVSRKAFLSMAPFGLPFLSSRVMITARCAVSKSSFVCLQLPDIFL